MAVLKSLLPLRRACSSASLLIRGAIGSLPSSLHNRLSSSRFHPFSANSPWPDRKPEISFPEYLPSDYTKVDRGEECMSLTRKTKDEINVKTHIMHHDAEPDNLSISGDSNFRDDASFNWIGDYDDVFIVVGDKIVYVGKLKLKRKLEDMGESESESEGGDDDHGRSEGEGEGESEGEGEGEGGDEGEGDDHGRSMWMSLKGFFKKRGF